jgi:putative holliday junction resolvase
VRNGVRLSLDVGKARVGVARCDPGGMMAFPVETVPRERALVRIVEIIEEYEPIEVVIGNPVNLRNEQTASTVDSQEFAQDMLTRVSVPLRLVDERMTTSAALGALRDSGRNAKNSRGVVDQVAAVILLQTCLDAERGGRILGELVEANRD